MTLLSRRLYLDLWWCCFQFQSDLLSGIVHTAMQNDNEQRPHHRLVSDGECTLLFQRLYEKEENLAIVEKVVEFTKCSLHGWHLVERHLQMDKE